MTVQVDVWLRGSDLATTEPLEGLVGEPVDWTDDDVRALLEGMLLAMHRRRYPEATDRTVVLRGISWIVNPFEGGGVVIALEVTAGAAVAGPFAIDRARLESMISRVLGPPPASSSGAAH